jgi:hypothetical protein
MKELSREEITQMYHQCFNTDYGKRVLEHLEIVFKGKTVSPQSDLYQIGIRDGRRDVIEQIKKEMEK